MLLATTLLFSASMAPTVSAVASASTVAACPVRLLEVGPLGGEGGDKDYVEGLHLVEDGLNYLGRLQSPLYVVPMLGVYRGGKSMLLNRIMGLRAPYTGGFGVGHGQQTFTRGIDICAEEVHGLGTVVWMDTEGLFSSQDARSAYGPKIFSLALLFSSAVMLNSVKVLNDQFFSFFSEQQQIARVLKQGLTAEGLPHSSLLPGNLSVFWILQQPVHFDNTSGTSQAQLEVFLNIPGDESRARVRRDFRHLLREVPTAVHDVRHWTRLDQLSDEELSFDYTTAAERVRKAVIAELQDARPLHAASVAKQLEMYVQVVQTDQFSGQLAKEAFEENELSALCSGFSRSAQELAGEFPTASLRDAFGEALPEIEERRASVAETFHFGADWTKRLNRCLHEKTAQLEQRNGELVLARWQEAAGRVAEEGSCFFLGTLVKLLREYATTYGRAFGATLQARAVDYGTALQRTRLVECIRLRDFVWPFLPWLCWPVLSLYLRNGALVSGMMSMLLHGVGLAGIYAVLQFSNQLPAYFDVDYPVLRMHPMLLGAVMRAPPMVPWSSFLKLVWFLGAVRSIWKLSCCIARLGRPAGGGYTVSQMVNLELKLNMVLKRCDATFRLQLATSALDAADCIERDDARAAALALLKGLCLVRELGVEERSCPGLADARLQKRIRSVLKDSVLPPASKAPRLCRACCDNNLVTCVTQADWAGLLGEMVRLLESMADSHAHYNRTPPGSPAIENVSNMLQLADTLTRRLWEDSESETCENLGLATNDMEGVASTSETSTASASEPDTENDHMFESNSEVDCHPELVELDELPIKDRGDLAHDPDRRGHRALFASAAVAVACGAASAFSVSSRWSQGGA